MEYVVYILWSENYDKTYVGFTSSLINRYHSHNSLSRKGWTKSYRPWKVVHLDFFETKQGALRKEKYYKSGVGRAYIKDNLREWMRSFE